MLEKIFKLKKENSPKKKICNWCGGEVNEYFWENLFKGFCDLECTNNYLESEGFNPINSQDESSLVKDEYRNI